jgi:hypothetical protein
MTSKRERYEQANMRGGLGVRKRLSEESLRDSYRLNGVRTGFAVARCLDRYGRWEYGYTVGVIVRKTASVVQVRWADTPEEIKTYDQGDARYEVDRQRWRILGLVQGNPLDPDNAIAVALTKLRQNASIAASAIDADSTDRGDEEVKKEMSNAAAERAAAKKALDKGELKERETYTAKQVATRCGTDPKTMRKFFRSTHSTIEPVGQGGRYEFDAKDFPQIKREFDAWQKKSKTRQQTPKPQPVVEVEEDTNEDISMEQVADAIERSQELPDLPDEDELMQGVKDIFGEDHEPTSEEMEELARVMAEQGDDGELDLDDLDED